VYSRRIARRVEHPRILNAMSDGSIVITPEVSVSASEITYRASRSSGPGGQHANTSSTRVELVWDVDASTALSDAQRARVREKLASRISADGLLILASEETRSQHRNREDVTERFAEILRQALHVPKARRKTRPSRASRERRLQTKKQRSETKKLRKPVSPD
jgi:ribosome-associated protein